MDAWIAEELRHAPAGLSRGWFISNLKFYDLQDSLSGGTLVAMALSVAVAFSVMLLTTWNIIISLYAILSIAGTIFVTVGSLVLLGWELNVLESVTISVAVGLSVDFAVHYGVAYRLAPEPDREGKVIFSLSRMGSAIAMAALTTFVAGAMMMPSTVLAYTQLGTFMMLIMCISWAFATFFFQCLCRCLGPQGACGQIPLPRTLQRQLLSQVASAGPSPRGKGAYGGGGVERYELEPLAGEQKAGEKAREEREACTQLCNGIPTPHRRLGESQSEAGSNGTAVHLSAPLRCPYPQSASCSCGDPPPPHQHPEWPPHSCARDPHTHHLFPRSANATNKQPSTALAAAPVPGPAPVEGHVHCVHCPPARLHQCAQGRVVGSRPGPTHGCSLRNPCSQQAAPAPAVAPAAQNPDRTPGSSPDAGQKTKPPPQTPEPPHGPDAPGVQKRTAKDSEPTGPTPPPAAESASMALAPEDAVPPSASPKKLCCSSQSSC